MSRKPWELTDDDLGTSSEPQGVPSTVDGVSAPDDGPFDDPFADDPFADGASASAPAPAPAAEPVRAEPADQPSAAPDEATTEAFDEPEPVDPFDEPEQAPTAPAQPPREAPAAPAGDVGAPDESSPMAESSVEAAPESSPKPEAGAPASENGMSPTPPARSVFDDDDDPDEWDDLVPAPEANTGSGGDGYALSSAPTAGPQTFSVPIPASGGAPSPAASMPKPPSDNEMTVKLRKPTEEELAQERERRRRDRERRGRQVPATREPQRRDKLAANAGKPTLMERMKGLFGPDEAKIEVEREVRRAAVRPVNVLLLGEKGGTGKTTITASLGMLMASVRGDRILALDGSPSGGTLATRSPKEGKGTVQSLVRQLDYVESYAHVREHTSQGPTGLEVLGASATRPEGLLTSRSYAALMDKLRAHYSVILSDGPGLFLSIDRNYQDTLLDEADVLVLGIEGIDGMDQAVKLVNYLKKRGAEDRHIAGLLDSLIVVVNSRESRTNVNVAKMVKYLRDEVARDVVAWPFDRALEGGTPIAFDRLSTKTRQAAMELAAAIASSPGFTGQ